MTTPELKVALQELSKYASRAGRLHGAMEGLIYSVEHYLKYPHFEESLDGLKRTLNRSKDILEES